MKTENLAIVFVDIAGFTPRTSAQTREENLRMLKRFDDVVRPLVRAYSGRVVKTIGDAYLLTFRSPTDALLCSVGIHDGLAESDAAIDPSERFTVRAAVNVGEVRLENNDVFGEAVNIAARIEGKAAAGEVYFSESVYLSMTKSEVPSEEVGYAELKGISGKVRLYRIPRAGESGYNLKQRETPAPANGSASHPLAPVALPFGGLGLDRVRDRLAAGPSLAAREIAEKLPGMLQDGASTAKRGFAWWREEVRRSRTMQYITIAVIIAIIALIVWGVKHKQKQATPLQKLQRSLGL
ncbi:MAG: adenylate/guanylate cyclase domain-containing protein [Nitrospiraceae bacterium]|nr:adenylate/guanylate cyclase domain-containing protein [Nitrospiraceae bacterium]